MTTRNNVFRVRFAVICLVAAATANSASADLFSVTDLGDLAGGTNFSQAHGINDAGQVVGYSRASTGDRAFLWDNGVLTDLGDLPSGDNVSRAYDINNSGQIAGYSGTINGSFQSVDRAVLWQSNGSMVDLGDLPGGADYSRAFSINAAGQVAGQSRTDFANLGLNIMHAFRWDSGSGMTDLGDLSIGEKFSSAAAINNAGDVVGESKNSVDDRGFLWTETDGISDVGVLADGVNSYARDINDKGEIVGRSDTIPNGLQSAFLRESDGTMVELADLPGGSDGGSAWAINELSQIVGSSSGANGLRAVLWENGSVFDLNDMVDASGAGWTLTRATDINESGQIVGYGTINGATHGFLLSAAAVPEPSSLLLLCTASGGMIVSRLLRRKKKSRAPSA